MIQAFLTICDKSSVTEVEENHSVWHFLTMEACSVETLRKQYIQSDIIHKEENIIVYKVQC